MKVFFKKALPDRLVDLRLRLQKEGKLEEVDYVELDNKEWNELHTCFNVKACEDLEGNIILYGLRLVEKF